MSNAKLIKAGTPPQPTRQPVKANGDGKTTVTNWVSAKKEAGKARPNVRAQFAALFVNNQEA